MSTMIGTGNISSGSSNSSNRNHLATNGSAAASRATVATTRVVSPLVNKLYGRLLECEQRMEALHFDLVTSVRAGDHRRAVWLECRHLVRSAYEELIIRAGGHESDWELVEGGGLLATLWTRLYYGPVEQVRVVLGQLEEHEVLRTDILSIIDEGMGFFLMLVRRLRHLPQPDGEAPNVRAGPDLPPVQRLVYECLTYLGDLSRYKVTFEVSLGHSTILINPQLGQGPQQPGGCLEIAKGFYKQAAHLLPNHGHAFNQLAVLFCMQENVLEGLCYYLRATVASRPFPRSADNLLTLCRRLANVTEDRLGLAREPALAALFGLLLRLVATVIAHELARASQMAHIESIEAALRDLLLSPGNGGLYECMKGREDGSESNSECAYTTSLAGEMERLRLLFAAIILATEFLQKSPSILGKLTDLGGGSGVSRRRYLGSAQLRLMRWLFLLASQLLRERVTEALPAVALLCEWIIGTDILNRVSNTSMEQRGPEFTRRQTAFLKQLASMVNENIENGKDSSVLSRSSSTVLDAEQYQLPLLWGTRPFEDFICYTTMTTLSWERILRLAVEHLCDKYLLLVQDSTGEYRLRWDTDGKTKQHAWLSSRSIGEGSDTFEYEHDCSSCGEVDLENEMAPTPCPSQWLISDADVMLKHWERLEGLLQVGAVRLIVTLSALRHLDFVKGARDGAWAARARKVMRTIATFSRTHSEIVHLQHPRETVLTLALPGSGGLSKHHRALLSALVYFKNDQMSSGGGGWAGGQTTVLTDDPQLMRFLDSLSIDYVCDIAPYLASL